MDNKKNHAVQFDNFGGTNVLYIAELSKPKPKKGDVVVRVKTAGINPGEASIREGKLKNEFPSTFPSGQGSDFAGIVEEVGENVTKFKAGNEVIGFTNERNGQAEYVVVSADQLIPRPAGISWEEAGSLFVAGTTAYAAVESVKIKEGEILIVSGAAGGVGSLVVQIARKKGAEVIGFASEANHQWLQDHGITPVSYHGDRQLSIEKILGNRKADAFIDTSGDGYVALAILLGIAPERIDTIIDFKAAEKYQVKTAGNAEGANAKVLGKVAEMVASRQVELPIAKTYPLDEVKQAYRELEKHHTHGKIVLIASVN